MDILLRYSQIVTERSWLGKENVEHSNIAFVCIVFWISLQKKLQSVKSTRRTFVRAGRISFGVIDWRGYSFLIGLGKSWTYFVSAVIFSYVASKVGFNIRGEEIVLRLQNGLRFKLRESHRLKNIFHKTSLCKPECRRTGSMWVGDMVAVRKAVRTEGSSVTLCLGHFYLKVLSFPGVTRCWVVCLCALIVFNVLQNTNCQLP